MTLQERITSLSEYDISLETYNGNFIVTIRYKKEWKINTPSDETIIFSKDKSDESVCYYAVPITGDIEKIFNEIDIVVQRNKEMEEKVVLYKEMREKMKELFRKEDIQTLRTLEFKFKKQKNKGKKSDTPSDEQVTEKNDILTHSETDEIFNTEENNANEVEKEEQEDVKVATKEEIMEGKRIDDLVSQALKRKNKK